MATISAEGEYFIIDGKRTRILSGTLHPARIARPLWADRLLAARQCGLNTVEVPALWAAIEPRPGRFDFAEQNDLASFCTIAADIGLRCILRAGPYIGDAYPLGGIPTWLLNELTGPPRSNDPSFLGPVARYFSALGEHLGKLQISTGSGRSRLRVGPICLVQAEHEWLCPEEQAGQYIEELARLLREAGFTVPIISRNMLFNSADTVLDTWGGYSSLYATVRQLRHIAPESPALVMGLRAGAENEWGKAKRSVKTPNGLLRAIAEVVAASGHVNLSPFHRGTVPAEFAGALPHAPNAFATSGGDTDAPLGEAGQRGPMYHAARMICTFVRSFERLLTDAEPDESPITVAPDAVAPRIADDDTGALRKDSTNEITSVATVTHRGSLGTVTYIFADEKQLSGNARTTLLLPDGSSLPVYLGSRSVSWVLTRAHLFNRATLDYTNLTPFMLVGACLVLVGPAGTPGLVSVNSAPLEVTVPASGDPVVEFHEGVTLVIANEEQAGTIYGGGDVVYSGVVGLTADDKPITGGSGLRINPDGTTERIRAAEASAAKLPKIQSVAVAPCDEYTSGTSARYASIPAPDTLNALGATTGYGWMRMIWSTNSAAKSDMTLFQCADRALVFGESKLVSVVGDTPGGEGHTFAVPGSKGTRTLCFLLDNMGRPSGGTSLIAPKGLFGSPSQMKKLRVPAPHLESADIFDPLVLFSPLMGVETGEVTHPKRVTFKVTHRRTTPLAIQIDGFGDRAVIFANGAAIGWHERTGNGRIILPPDILSRGINIIQFAVFEDPDTALGELKKSVTFFDLDVKPYEKASWAFARWEQPSPGAFEQLAKADVTAPKLAKYKGTPAWWRVSFSPADSMRPLYLDAKGLTKGRLYLNGHDIGRYFVATHTGKSVPPQSRYYLPECWLNSDAPNELMIFDEHGAAPNKITFMHSS
ncbi:MAG: beta-galactosidase [Phycisphaeraceae bacterium]|nr:beta-galactosidase [Phycisphaerales bacterium]MCB9843973.1 beta-galactosidase [Phycisphaeraceae bacterium]